MREVVAQRVAGGRDRAGRTLDERALMRCPRMYPVVARLGLTMSPRLAARRRFIRRQVLSGWEAVNRGDLELMKIRYAPDVIYESTPALVALGMRDRAAGTAALMAVVAEFGAVWSQQTFALEFIVDGRGWILTLGHFTGRGATSGVEAQTAFAQVIDFRDGLVIRERDFNEWAEALAVTGLDAGTIARLDRLATGDWVEL